MHAATVQRVDPEQEDLAALHDVLAKNRLLIALLIPLVARTADLLGDGVVPWLPVALVGVANAGLNPLYEYWRRRALDLGTLVRTQLIVDALAITAALAALGQSAPLFGASYLVAIVPATLVSPMCALVVTLLAAFGFGGLLTAGSLASMHHVTTSALFLAALLGFVLVAVHGLLYKRHLREKNRRLNASSVRLAEVNHELSVTAETAIGLLEVSRTVGTSLDLGVVIDRLHAVAVERLKTDWCATVLVDPGSPSGYRLMASRGFGAESSLPVGDAFWDFGALIAAEGLVEIEDAAREPVVRALQHWRIASGLFAAMRCGNRTVGIFATGHRLRTGGFAPYQRKVAVGIATQAAVAIENATLHTKQREEAEISAALLKVAELLNANLDVEDRLDRMAALTCALADCDFTNVVLYDQKRNTFRPAAGADVRHPHLLEEARELDFDLADFPILQEASRAGFAETCEGDGTATFPAHWWDRWSLKSVLVVPLYLRAEVVGALVVGSREHARPFHVKVRRLLTGIAYQTVTALENTRLLCNLRAATRVKSEFISAMSHELRTPLNAIIGYSELLCEGEFGAVTESQREICARVLDSSQQLLELIQATLDVSRLESGALPVTLGPVSVPALLDDVALQVPSNWAKPGVQLLFDVAPDFPELQSDYAKLKMVVRNLVHNALKFTEAGAVTVTAELEEGGAVLGIAVSDTGIGISAESQTIVFDMFRQVDGSDRRRHDGVGLGLYIVRQLTVLLGGTVTVESEVGRGSCFRVRVPVVITSGRPQPLLGARAQSA